MATYNLLTTTPTSLKKNDILNCAYSGAVKQITLPKGKYKLECWGAQGGGYQNNSSLDTAIGGKGGYSVGTLELSKKVVLFLYVGGMGLSSSSGIAKGGFNGGGAAYATSSSEPANGGGGGSDIRISTDSLYARVIVAGAGGGGGEDSGDVPGYGGGETGGSSSGLSTVAGQTSTGTGGVFGLGANTNYDGGGGGGGWYGGGTRGGSQTIPTSNSGSDTSGGCGGSGYVYTSTTASNYPTGCLLTSIYYLSNASTTAGNQSMTDPESGSTVTGRSGHGYIRITVIETGLTLYTKVSGSIKTSTSSFVKVNGVWKSVSDVYVKVNGTWKKGG